MEGGSSSTMGHGDETRPLRLPFYIQSIRFCSNVVRDLLIAAFCLGASSICLGIFVRLIIGRTYAQAQEHFTIEFWRLLMLGTGGATFATAAALSVPLLTVGFMTRAYSKDEETRRVCERAIGIGLGAMLCLLFLGSIMPRVTTYQ